MHRLSIFVILALLYLASAAAPPCRAASPAATPFYTFNQSPLVQIFGLPAAESATIQKPGQFWGLLSSDLASNYTFADDGREKILLDGESYRTTFVVRYGIAERFEVGADLPLVGYGGGFLDGLIEGWHDVFGLPQGGRKQAPRDRLVFDYQRDGRDRLHLTDGNFGLGDLRLNGAWQLYQDGQAGSGRALALRASLKLPTGSSERLRGSGSTDFALWLTGCDDYLVAEGRMHLALFGAAGLLALTDGEVLTDRQNHLVGFGSFGAGWSPRDWIAFKAQLSTHSPFFRSDLRELGWTTLQFLFGGTLSFTPRTALDIGFSEDVRVSTSPDLGLHLGLSHQF